MEQTELAAARGRIHLMDELRGFAIFCMVFFHGFYTVGVIFGVPLALEFLYFFTPAEPWFAGLFILISGISSDLSRSNLKRGIKLFIVALVVSAATALVVPGEFIVFGILHFLSVCMTGYGLWNRFFKSREKSFSAVVTALCFLLFFATYPVQSGYLGFPPLAVRLPGALYSTDWLSPFGFHTATFTSADYFPLLPWAFLFVAGTQLGRLAAGGRFPAFSYVSRIPFFAWLGRHSLAVYVLHQPVIYGCALAISFLAGK